MAITKRDARNFLNLYPKLTLKETEKLLAMEPVLVGQIWSILFYEHPTEGDDCGLLAYDADHRTFRVTDWFDVPPRFYVEWSDRQWIIRDRSLNNIAVLSAPEQGLALYYTALLNRP